MTDPLGESLQCSDPRAGDVREALLSGGRFSLRVGARLGLSSTK